MIADHIKNRGRYLNCHKNIAAALEYIARHADEPGLKDGTYPVIPDEVIVHVVTKDTHAREDAKMEIHKNFMDIHYIIRGGERCYMAPLAEEGAIDYDPETDNGFWDCADSCNVMIGEGEFYAVWPMEPHCPLCDVDGEPKEIRKIICKVNVEQGSLREAGTGLE